ncbi:MAG TPA: hypothetical protein VHG10_00305 [Glycomyces sp.]|nr:hypothetical protein [Glycomyces sp.]
MESEESPVPGDRETMRKRAWPRRTILALVVALVQLLVAAVVILGFGIVGETVPSDSNEPLQGLAYLIYGMIAAPVVATVVGALAAAWLRLPLYGLYAVPVPLGVLAGYGAAHSPVFGTSVALGVAALLLGDALIGATTCRRPRRPPRRRKRTGTEGTPA